MREASPVGPFLRPDDEHDRELVAHTHPPDWSPPSPAGRYNLVVIGAGTAGLVTAAGAAGLGARVALIESRLMGGDCLNFGCVPSKALLRSARAAADVRGAGELGVRVPDGVEVHFGAVMERMRRLRASIAHHDSAERFRSLGVDVFLGRGRFVADDAVEVDGRRLRFSKAVVATGMRAAELPIPGLAEAGYLTNETLFTLTELPRRLAVIGGGPIGCEMAQAFRRFGSDVTLLEAMPQVLVREDPDAAAIVQGALARDGVDLRLGVRVTAVRRDGDERVVEIEIDGERAEVRVDAVLVSVGRVPNVEQLGLEAVGVEVDPRAGVVVDDRLRTRNRRIYAAGDVASRLQFTHLADAQARIVIQNALFPFGRKVSSLVVPWCTYTDPELAHVGLSEQGAAEQGVPIETFVQPMAEVDRAILDGDTEGFVKVHVRRGRDTIVGATIVARHAGEMISEVAVAMAGGLGLGKISNVIHPYPTQADGIRRTGDLFNRTRLTPRVRQWFERWLAWTR